MYRPSKTIFYCKGKSRFLGWKGGVLAASFTYFLISFIFLYCYFLFCPLTFPVVNSYGLSNWYPVSWVHCAFRHKIHRSSKERTRDFLWKAHRMNMCSQNSWVFIQRQRKGFCWSNRIEKLFPLPRDDRREMSKLWFLSVEWCLYQILFIRAHQEWA